MFPVELNQGPPRIQPSQAAAELRPTPFRPPVPRSGVPKPQRPPPPEGEVAFNPGALVPGTPVIGGQPVPLAPLGMPPIPQSPPAPQVPSALLAPDPNQVYGPGSYPKSDPPYAPSQIDLAAFVRENDQLRLLVAQLEEENRQLRANQTPTHTGLVAIDDSVVTVHVVSAEHLENFQEYLLLTLDEMWERVNTRCTDMEHAIHEKVDSVFAISNALKALTQAAGTAPMQPSGEDDKQRPPVPRRRRTGTRAPAGAAVASAPLTQLQGKE
jgi:hypothetical protein